MATINSSAIFPSIKLLETDSVGDVQEVSSQSATSSTATIQGIKIDSVATGVASDGVGFEILEGQSANGISATNNVVSLALQFGASNYKLNEYSINGGLGSHTFIGNGDFIYFIANDTLTLTDLSTSSGVSLNFNKGDSFECLGNDSAGRPIIEISGTQYKFSSTNFNTTWGERIDSIATIIATAGSDVTDLVAISIVGADGDNLTGTGSVTTANGQDASEGDLDPNAKYVMLKIDDIYDLQDSEFTDGRKLLWGVIETASNVFSQLTDAPENLTITRSSKSLVNNQTNLRQTYTIVATYEIGSVDLKGEA